MRTILSIQTMWILVVLMGCREAVEPSQGNTFGNDVEFLSRYVEVIRLEGSGGKSQAAVVPAWQGRVMTSSNGGWEGPSFGWINRDLIASRSVQPHINPYGGEDRFWLGPEGGQFSLFFRPGDPFDLEHWQTPACVDTVPWQVTDQSPTSVSFKQEVELVNYSNTPLSVRIDRIVKLLDETAVNTLLGAGPPEELDIVVFSSENKITNAGSETWTKETGLLSIWILGMYVPSPTTTIILPFRKGPLEELGPIVNDRYFGKVPADRLQIGESVIYFRADGRYRSKIGLSPFRARSVVGSYDTSRNLLTIVEYNRPEGLTDYVNSMWEIQEEPYRGDVINGYNDGPPAPGSKPLGPFYELETSSPAVELAPGESVRHLHRTFHFTGPQPAVAEIAQQVLGVELSEIPEWPQEEHQR